MYEYYLKAPSERLLRIYLQEVNLLEINDGTTNIDFIGNISGNTGYHANILMNREMTTEEKQALSSILIDAPTTPTRTWWI